jgi:hypothetical protein
MVSPRETHFYLIAAAVILFGTLGLISYIEGGDQVRAEQEGGYAQSGEVDRHYRSHGREVLKQRRNRRHIRYSTVSLKALT